MASVFWNPPVVVMLKWALSGTPFMEIGMPSQFGRAELEEGCEFSDGGEAWERNATGRCHGWDFVHP